MARQLCELVKKNLRIKVRRRLQFIFYFSIFIIILVIALATKTSSKFHRLSIVYLFQSYCAFLFYLRREEIKSGFKTLFFLNSGSKTRYILSYIISEFSVASLIASLIFILHISFKF